jgi:hypothetical protein
VRESSRSCRGCTASRASWQALGGPSRGGS